MLTGYLTIASGALVLMVFSEQQVAFYGTSGIIYALGGFALTHIFRLHIYRSMTELIVVAFGAVALIDVVIDPFTGPYFVSGWINGGHTLGMVIGVAVGWFELDRCEL